MSAPIVFGVLLGLLGGAALPAQEPAAADQLVGQVEAALEKGDEETAGETLLRAEDACAALPPGLARSRLIGRLKPARARVGAVLDAMQRAERDAARALVKAADTYAGRGWHLTATDLLDEARRIDAETAKPRRPPKPGLELIGVGNQLPRLFAPAQVEMPYAGDPWVLGAELVASRLRSRETTAVFSHFALRGSYEVRARITVPPTACKFALAFAFQAASHSYYLVELVQGPRRSDLRLYTYQNNTVRRLAETTLPTSALRQLGGEVGVFVSEAGVRASAGGASLTLARTDLPLPTDGSLGFLISGDTPFAGPFVVEALAVEQR